MKDPPSVPIILIQQERILNQRFPNVASRDNSDQLSRVRVIFAFLDHWQTVDLML